MTTATNQDKQEKHAVNYIENLLLWVTKEAGNLKKANRSVIIKNSEPTNGAPCETTQCSNNAPFTKSQLEALHQILGQSGNLNASNFA